MRDLHDAHAQSISSSQDEFCRELCEVMGFQILALYCLRLLSPCRNRVINQIPQIVDIGR